MAPLTTTSERNPFFLESVDKAGFSANSHSLFFDYKLKEMSAKKAESLLYFRFRDSVEEG